MSALCQQTKQSTAIVRNKDISNWGAGAKARRKTPAPATPLLSTLPRSRREEILAIRRQIAEGTYDLDKRLDSVLDRLLQDLVA